MQCDSGPPTLKVLSTLRLPRTSVQSCSSRPLGPCIPATRVEREQQRMGWGLGAPAIRGGISAGRNWAMDIRIITKHDVEEFIRLRLEALTREPYAFARAPEDEHSRSPESVAPRLRAAPEGNFVVGAFEGMHMVDQHGFVRNEILKERHKGTICVVYVTAAARGQGVAKAMLTQLLDRVRGYPGLEQVSLSVSIPQEAARRLYSALGFEVYGYEKHALKVGETYVDEEHRVLWLQEPLSA